MLGIGEKSCDVAVTRLDWGVKRIVIEPSSVRYLPSHNFVPGQVMYAPRDSNFSSWDEMSLLFSHLVVSNSLRPHGLQHARLLCPSPSPEVCPSSYLLHQWCHLVIAYSDALFSCPQSFPASGTFPMSQLFASDDQNTGVTASAAVLPMSIQGWFVVTTTYCCKD